MTRRAATLWHFTFTRVAAALFVLLLLVGSAGFLLVTRPALDRNAQWLVKAVAPAARPDCRVLRARVNELAQDPESGIRLLANEANTAWDRLWLLPFDALVMRGLADRTGLAVQARSTVQALQLQLRCQDADIRLAVDRHIALGAAPDLALLAWLLGLVCGALGIAAWLSRALSAPMNRLVSQLRATPLGGTPAAAAAPGIAELDQLGLEVEALRLRASEAVASRTALLMGISHDLRTPLARVRLILDTAPALTADDGLEMKAHVREMQEALDEFMRAANAMAAAPVDGGARIVWDRLQALFTDTRMLFSARPDDLAEPLNSAALLRVAANLIDNALRHGAGCVEVQWQRQAGAWRLCVTDQGKGIAPGEMARVLRPFGSNAAAATGVSSCHAGIGLALVKILCEHNAWTLSMDAAQHSRFTVCVDSSALSHL